MKLLASVLVLFLVRAITAHTLECSAAALAKYLPSNATITFAHRVAEHGTFNVPSSNIAYPTSPTNMKELCAVQVHVVSSATSAYSFGLFLPTAWNKRFLYVSREWRTTEVEQSLTVIAPLAMEALRVG
jgi:feruloyl esterase